MLSHQVKLNPPTRRRGEFHTPQAYFTLQSNISPTRKGGFSSKKHRQSRCFFLVRAAGVRMKLGSLRQPSFANCAKAAKRKKDTGSLRGSHPYQTHQKTTTRRGWWFFCVFGTDENPANCRHSFSFQQPLRSLRSSAAAGCRASFELPPSAP